jgi:hypothetical protein
MKRNFMGMGHNYLEGIRGTLKTLGKHKSIWQQVLDAVEDVELFHVWYDGAELNLSLNGGGSRLAAVVRQLRRLGFETDSKPKAGDTSYSTHFKHPSGAQVYVTFTSTVCRRIQVGVEMVEKPIYEVVCDDGVTA